MSEWIEYTGSNEQIEEMKGGFLYRTTSGSQSDIALNESNFDSIDHLKTWMRGATHYLAAKPHPYADLIKIWADTGCPVWVRPRKPYEFKISDYLNHPTTRLMVDGKGVYLITTTPDWNIPGAEYSLTPFED